MCSHFLAIIVVAIIIALFKQVWVTWILNLWPWNRKK